MRTYSQIEGDGGSGVAEQIADLEAAIARRMAGIRHVVAVGSGKGGVGKSTLTRQLGAVLAAEGKRVGILDADMNGPSQAMLNGVRNVPPLPGEEGLLVPISRDGLKVLSVGSLLAEGEALSWPSTSPRHSHVWRATRELAKLAELLAAVHWGPLDILLVDLPPGPERTAQFADFLGPDAAVLLVSIPSALARGVVARSVSALAALPNRLLGHVENMSGYACAGCGTVRPLFPAPVPGDREAAELALPCLGRVPFDPQLAALSDEGRAITEVAEAGPVAAALAEVARNLIHALEVP
jgi:ATP-binding protein involved in chromosome partitioning